MESIAQKCPEWFRPIVWTGYYTGMRRGEILSLKRHKIDLSRRIITLSPEETKEGHWKRVPIHRNLVPILDNARFSRAALAKSGIRTTEWILRVFPFLL